MLDNKQYLEKLISIDTQFHKNTLEAVEYVKSVLSEYKIPVKLIYNDNKTRASLVATIGDKNKPGYVFSGHLDTVAADESFYKKSPFKMFEENGKLYGRGTCDMKGSTACFLAKLPDIIASGKTVHLVLTHDEEGGFKAINQIVRTPELAEMLKKQKACIVMEPSELKPVIAHKGTRLIEVNVTGKSGHSSNPDICIDAIDIAVQAYNKIIGGFRVLSQQYGPNKDFLVPFSTVTVGKFNGGEAINTVSASADFSILSRENPGDDYEKFFEQVLKDFKTNGIVTTEQKLYALAFKSTCEMDFIKSINSDCQIVNYGTEAGFFELIGLSTIVCGPGSIVQAHTKDEYIEVDQLNRWEQLIGEIINRD